MKLILFILILKNSFPQKIILEQTPFKKDSIIQLATQNKELIFEINSTKNDSNYYFYKLENFDNQWNKSKYPIFRYTNLEGGDYRFLWKVGNQKANFISIKKEKSLTEEWWFLPSLIFYIVLLISAALYFFVLYNLRQKVKIQSIRNRIASDLHDEVGSTLSSISIFTRIAEKKIGNSNAEISDLLDKIKTESDETITTIRDTVWAINPENDDIGLLFEKMRSMAFQILNLKEIQFDFINEINKSQSISINMEQRRNIFLIFKEAINNIVKHSEATAVKMTIKKVKNEIEILIQDNGRGFDSSEIFEGNGLKNFQKRANEGFLFVNLQSNVETGTSIKINIPEI